MTPAQYAGKYIMYTRSLAVWYRQTVAQFFAAVKICGQTDIDRPG